MRGTLIVCVLLCLLYAISGSASPEKKKRVKKSIFSPKNIHKVIEIVSPILSFTNPAGEAKKSQSSFENAFKKIKDTLATSGQSDEDWLTFGKRLASLYLTGSKEIPKGKNVLDGKLANTLYKKSPQFLKDYVKAHIGGSILPVLEEKVKNILQTIKEKNGTKIKVEGKEELIVFDPLVFGVNSMINLFWFAAFNAVTLPNMGLDNLFYPDYDYDYDVLDEEDEEVIGGEDYDDEDYLEEDYQEGENKLPLFGGSFSNNIHQGNNHQQAHHTNSHQQAHHANANQHQIQHANTHPQVHHVNTQLESSYMYYPGQRMQLPTANHITPHPHKVNFDHNRRHMFRPNSHG